MGDVHIEHISLAMPFLNIYISQTVRRVLSKLWSIINDCTLSHPHTVHQSIFCSLKTRIQENPLLFLDRIVTNSTAILCMLQRSVSPTTSTLNSWTRSRSRQTTYGSYRHSRSWLELPATSSIQCWTSAAAVRYCFQGLM